MCGIVGLINNTHFNNEKDLISTVKHRGRVSNNHISFDNHFFGHTLLNTTDKNLNSSSQPMISEVTGNVISFNGEVFNFKEIKQTHLISQTFKTQTDTEVILKMFDKYGIQCLDYFIGDFAIAFFSKKENCFYLARDRVGNKPLYYSKFNETVIFSSESRSIRNFLKKDKVFSYNLPMIASYLNINHLPLNKNSFFNEINQVESSTYIKINSNGKLINKVDYWTDKLVNKFNKRHKVNYNEVTEELFFLINDAVSIRSRCIYDNYSLSLSGGIDSNTLLNILTKSDKKISTYTFVEENDNQENSIINHFINDIKFQNVKKNIFSKNDLDYHLLIDKISKISDVPAPDMSFIFNLFLNEKLANQDNQAVLFDGGGGDEVFHGHQHHLQFFLSQLLYDLKFKKYLNYISKYKSYNHKNIYFYILKSFYHLLPISIKNIYKKNESKKANFLSNDFNYINFEDYTSKQPLLNCYINTINNWVMPNVTSIFDKIAGFHGTILRNPFTDHRLFEYVISLNYEKNFEFGTKSLLRKNKYLDLNSKIMNRNSKSQFPGGQNSFVYSNFNEISEYVKRNVITSGLFKFRSIDINKISQNSGKLLRYYLFLKWHNDVNKFIT